MVMMQGQVKACSFIQTEAFKSCPALDLLQTKQVSFLTKIS
jgi:hypothetical protein